MEAAHYERLDDNYVRCQLCPHGCTIAPGKRGRCRVRENRDGALAALTYGQAASLALDPIEKKPLYHFLPGRQILSLGSWGCNLSCSFCQNWSISQHETDTQGLDPDYAVRMAQQHGSAGMAYTYNEPFIMWEYLRDCGRAMHDANLKNVLVTNGFVNPDPLEELLPLIDAMNIDIKAFHEGFYQDLCGGSLSPVLRTVERAARGCHVEITTLIIPERNDAPKEIDEEARWIAEHCGPQTPVHLSAYTPRYRLQANPTPIATLTHARGIMRQHLRHVYLGNVRADEGADTICHACGAAVIARRGYQTDSRGMHHDGTCAKCGADNGIVTR